jgi:hypothetical protein
MRLLSIVRPDFVVAARDGHNGFGAGLSGSLH